METAPKEKWPKELIIPSEEDFRHGNWVEPDANSLGDDRYWDVKYDSELSNLSSKDRETLISCGTQCCLVGWAALAFGEQSCSADYIKNPATAKFLAKICELAGYKIPEPIRNDTKKICYFASNVFEKKIYKLDSVDLSFSFLRDIPEDENPYFSEGLTPEQAAEYWEQAAEFFGYDVDNSIKIK